VALLRRAFLPCSISSALSPPFARARTRSSLRGRVLLWPSRPSAERGAYRRFGIRVGEVRDPRVITALSLSLSLSRARARARTVPTSILASLFTLYLARLALRRSSSNFYARRRAIARSFPCQFSLSPHVRLFCHRDERIAPIFLYSTSPPRLFLAGDVRHAVQRDAKAEKRTLPRQLFPPLLRRARGSRWIASIRSKRRGTRSISSQLVRPAT